MPSAALRPKNPCRASLIEGWSVGIPVRPHPTSPTRGSDTLLTLAAERGKASIDPPPLAGEGGEGASGRDARTPARVNLSHALFQARLWKMVQTPLRRSGES